MMDPLKMSKRAGQTLGQKIALLRGGLDRSSSSFFGAQHVERAIPEALYRTYRLASESVPLMKEACGRLPECELSAGERKMVQEYLEHHMVEEKEHAAWLLEDLQHAGQPAEAIDGRLTPTPIAALLGTVSYRIRRDDALSLFGYMAVLEGCITTEARVIELCQRSGLPSEVFRTWREHARIDGGHSQEIFEMLDRLVINERQASAMGMMAIETLHYLAQSDDDLAALGAAC